MSGLRLRAVVADRGLDVEFSVEPGEVLAVLGPNGAGKSTALHVIAGLVRPDEGLVRLGERVLTDTATGIDIATHNRRVGLLPQDPLLFPHLSVAANVAFGLRHSGRRGWRGLRRRCRESARRWLREVDAEELADRRPRQLSGGQAQRVAIARALAAEPDALLLDEPLAGLDVGAAGAVRAVLRKVVSRDARATVLVTHDLLDVFTLADRVLVLESGRVAETGPVADVLTAPRSHFGARIAGVNLVNGTIGPDGALHARSGALWQGTAAEDLACGQAAVAVFAPAAVAVYREAPHGSPRNAVEVTVAELDSRGSSLRVRGGEQPDGAPGLAADITVDAAVELGLTPGQRVWFAVKAQEVTLYPTRPTPQPTA
ncbi:sulfate/molybdate ABC transporter ATP-binding protein [Mycobacterium xenopi]|uniref:sulfate/molybdate ABC transporter ATP-binding protein n=1 Tax=Mycobacterium xenopi TaxID=1789 RepID=UPI00025ACE19|nr:ATP-binding cassette domain-containing protein [Mycobacterium xenopi]EID11866.1 molybdenum-transport ATP-binding protein ABC transporter modC [Mycobacterium xenopi RIVM700367]MDA3640175.1 ATP-binding cassette domain-containing protein [Mycobacterium xenopi]MDA3658512.1 ATP-binding cassette domain-containing protein [Mycobacterium xenopi]MDA3662463.1 ATP-binding cassette domain-containing protein [Mycobacterium xenopi]ORX19496.1 molybdenum ABC transporter ATP-binding protein [Mycobacterium x